MVTCCLWSQKLNIFLKSVQQHPKLFCSASSLCYNIILWQLCAHLQECWTWPPPAYCRQMHAGLWLHSSLMEDGEHRGSAAHHNVDVTASFASWCVKTFTALHCITSIFLPDWWFIRLTSAWCHRRLKLIWADTLNTKTYFLELAGHAQGVVSFFYPSFCCQLCWQGGGKQAHSSPCLIHRAATVNVQRGGKDNFSQGRLPGTTLDHRIPSSPFSPFMNKNAVKVYQRKRFFFFICRSSERNFDF